MRPRQEGKKMAGIAGQMKGEISKRREAMLGEPVLKRKHPKLPIDRIRVQAARGATRDQLSNGEHHGQPSRSADAVLAYRLVIHFSIKEGISPQCRHEIHDRAFETERVLRSETVGNLRVIGDCLGHGADMFRLVPPKGQARLCRIIDRAGRRTQTNPRCRWVPGAFEASPSIVWPPHSASCRAFHDILGI